MLLFCDAIRGEPDRQELGGKGAGLVALRRMRLRVPPFWIVPRSALQAAAGARADGWPIPTELPAALAALPDRRLFAVRSSAVDEDSGEHSFAGVLESVLNVPREGLSAAIRRVWASGSSARACQYRRRKGLPEDEAAMAVVIQEMVQAAAAGVLFTRDPEDGAPRVVIAAGFGLGQGVVSDAVASDTYRIGWDDDAVARDVSEKRTRIVLADARRGGTVPVSVPERDVRRPVLRPGQVRALRDLGRDLERAFGSPQDVEWACDRRGRLFVLQARPVAPATAPPGVRRVWDNANVVESYPGLTRPLTFSFARRAYRATFARVAHSFLALGGRAPSAEVFDRLIGLLTGRVYYNLLAWYELFEPLPGSERYRESWDRLIGVAPSTGAPRVREVVIGRLARVGTLLTSAAMLPRVRSRRRRFFAAFEAFLARHGTAGRHETTPEAVISSFAALERDAARFWHLTIQNDFCALKYHAWLAALLARWGDGHDGVLGGLVAGPHSVESVAPVRSLLALVDAVRADPALCALFEGADDAAAWTILAAEPRWRGIRDAFERHRRAFGDRSVAELKLDTVTFEEQPARLVALVKQHLRGDLSVARLDRRRGQTMRRAARLRRRAVRGPLRGFVFRFVVDRAREAIRAREDMRLARTRLFGIARRLFGRLGRLLHEQGVLASPLDVHDLTVEELTDLVHGTGVTRDVRALVALRRAEYAAHAAAPAPTRFETLGIPAAAAALDGGVRERAPGSSRQGTGCAPGRATGRAVVVRDPERATAVPGQVLVAASTDPGWVFLMMSAAAVVVERGSLLSHTAIIGRELGIPTVVGVADATRAIPDGAPVTVDGGTGVVRWA